MEIDEEPNSKAPADDAPSGFEGESGGGIGEEREQSSPSAKRRDPINSKSSTSRPKWNSKGLDDDMYNSPLDSWPEVYFIGFVLIAVASIFTRLYNIDLPRHVA